jgi:hypothetical protein
LLAVTRSRGDRRRNEGYDTDATSVGRLHAMPLAASYAFSKTFGLVVVFGGIGVIVNLIIVYIAIQIRGEHRANQEELMRASKELQQ